MKQYKAVEMMSGVAIEDSNGNRLRTEEVVSLLNDNETLLLGIEQQIKQAVYSLETEDERRAIIAMQGVLLSFRLRGVMLNAVK